MWNEPDAIIRSELSTGEQLLWSGRPRAGFRFLPGDWFAVPFMLMWTGFVAFAFISVLRTGGPSPSLFFFTPFLLVGFAMLFGRYIFDIIVRRHTCYGLTNERALIVRRLFGTRVQSVALKILPEITLSSTNDRIGSIFLGRANPSAMWNGMNLFSSAYSSAAPAFEMVDYPRKVFELAREAQRSAQER